MILSKKLVQALTAGLIVAAGITTPAIAANDVELSDAWIRQPRGNGKMTGAFLKITNRGKQIDQLIEANCACANVTEIHESTQHEGMVKMHRVPSIDLKQGETVALKPGSFHIMLMGLKKPLKAGDTVQLQLKFKQAGAKTVAAKVKDQ